MAEHRSFLDRIPVDQRLRHGDLESCYAPRLSPGASLEGWLTIRARPLHSAAEANPLGSTFSAGYRPGRRHSECLFPAPLFFERKTHPRLQDLVPPAIYACSIWALYSSPPSLLLLICATPGAVAISRGKPLKRTSLRGHETSTAQSATAAQFASSQPPSAARLRSASAVAGCRRRCG